MLNGPCGGSDQGKCEISKEMPCGWQLIYERLKTLGQLDRFEKPVDPKDWTSSPGRRHRARSSERIYGYEPDNPEQNAEKLLAARATLRSPPKSVRPGAPTAT